ncbi:hypothetical protein [Mesorhizobium sp. M1273]|uniref:pPIWI-associating nuclease domain-containing protein n=1 Tax=Mesorhizobium sp. M1273 TaxID=2957075 RepID=UPI00333DBE22
MDNKERQLKQQRIALAVQDVEPTETEAWTDLALLSSNTRVDTVETFEREVRIDGEQFSGPITWYVVLEYGPRDGDDALTTSESFPGTFEGHFEGETPIVDRMTVDTSSFYA